MTAVAMWTCSHGSGRMGGQLQQCWALELLVSHGSVTVAPGLPGRVVCRAARRVPSGPNARGAARARQRRRARRHAWYAATRSR